MSCKKLSDIILLEYTLEKTKILRVGLRGLFYYNKKDEADKRTVKKSGGGVPESYESIAKKYGTGKTTFQNHMRRASGRRNR